MMGGWSGSPICCGGLLPDHPTGVLVAGVGNTAITADALGPETNRYVLATRHIAGELRRALGPLTDVSTLTFNGAA